MKKLSRIVESTWGDIARRAEGEQIRKEDDINHLDSEDLYEYLKKIYKEFDSFQSIKLHPTMNTISVPIFVQGFKPYRVFFEFDNEEIFIEYTMPYAITGFFSKLRGKFHLQQYDTKQGMPAKFYIFPKDGSDITNRFFIEVIDFLLDCIPNSDDKCIERVVNESTWGDIARRAEGEQIRKEDDVNLLDYDAFGEYIRSIYIPKNDRCKILPTSVLRVPVVFELDFMATCIEYREDVNEIWIPYLLFKDHWKGLFKKLNKNFLMQVNSNKKPERYIISPKDGS